jgi:trigger factor
LTKIGFLEPKALDHDLFAQVFPNDIVKDEADFRARISKELSREFDRMSRERLHNEIFELLVHQTPIQLPVGFLKRWMMEGQEKPRSASEVDKEFPSFDHQLRWTLISDKLIQENGISVSTKEVNDDIKTKVLAYFGMDSDEEAPWMDSYMQKVSKDQKTMDETYRRLLFERLFQFLETKFPVTDKDVTEEEFFKLPDAHAAHHHHH